MKRPKLVTWLLFGVSFAALPFVFQGIGFAGLRSRPTFYWYYL